MYSLHSVRLLSILLVGVLTDPAPGRVPKVYNALITSNQNLEPSKAFPVYQPVLHDTFAYPFRTAFLYSDLLNNGVLPQEPSLKELQSPEASPTTAPSSPAAPAEPTSENVEKSPEPAADGKDTKAALPIPPKTESPILLNAFGLPPQVLPLGHVDSIFNTLPQYNPFTYPYPSLRFYDPYDPFSFNLPSLYRPFHNVVGPQLSAIAPVAAGAGASDKKAGNDPAPTESSDQTPPPADPNDLNILNYSSKDPAIPNVPPPPLPQGGLKSDKSE